MADSPEPVFAPPNFSTDLSGQTALVTGAASGLGRRFAQVLASSGAKVAATDVRCAEVEEVASAIRASGAESRALSLDMTDTAQLCAIVERAEDELGMISILVNCAGIPDARFATKMPIELVDRVIATNLRGPYVLAVEVARRLIERKAAGRIVNISSMGAYYAEPRSASTLYSVTKAGLDRMTETLAVEWARFHINVNSIAPGTFATELTEQMLARTGDITGRFPRGRLGLPEQLDSTLLYLVSPSSELVTGTVIKVDDGQLPR
jgi:NAD(P)-dependent dehydrogenase (short-subunit alcohol dehydrogenase family)